VLTSSGSSLDSGSVARNLSGCGAPGREPIDNLGALINVTLINITLIKITLIKITLIKITLIKIRAVELMPPAFLHRSTPSHRLVRPHAPHARKAAHPLPAQTMGRTTAPV
jgi:hypothetical protein